jgi:acyl carrier protein
LIVADVDLVDADGRVLVHIEGFTMRQVDRTSLDGEPGASAVVEDVVRPVHPSALAANAGIPPAVGAELVLTLLSARTPEQVVVRPYVDGRPVALPDAARPARSKPTLGVAEPAAVPVARQVLDHPGSATEPAASTANGSVSTIERLRALWVETLGIADIGPEDDFFELGGNSLSAVQLMSRVRDGFAVELSIALLFEAPTLDELSALLDQQARN